MEIRPVPAFVRGPGLGDDLGEQVGFLAVAPGEGPLDLAEQVEFHRHRLPFVGDYITGVLFGVNHVTDVI